MRRDRVQLKKIITLANPSVRHQLTGMVRSLRGVGCDLPVFVIPHDDAFELFTLPEGCEWWIDESYFAWLREEKAHPRMRKYLCLMEENYHFVDCDLAFVKNPMGALLPMEGFVTTCNHWNRPGDTVTSHSLPFFQARATLWQKLVFNSGQFACDRPLYEMGRLKELMKDPLYTETLLRCPFHEQPGLNLLVLLSGVSVVNMTLPPSPMESTWAGDYPGDYRRTWTSDEKIPYLIHYAGCWLSKDWPISELFFKYYNPGELKEVRNEIFQFLHNTLHHRTPQWRRFLSGVRRAWSDVYST